MTTTFKELERHKGQLIPSTNKTLSGSSVVAYTKQKVSYKETEPVVTRRHIDSGEGTLSHVQRRVSLRTFIVTIVSSRIQTEKCPLTGVGYLTFLVKVQKKRTGGRVEVGWGKFVAVRKVDQNNWGPTPSFKKIH